MERPIELVNVLEIGLKSKPHQTALVSLERTWSWWELEQASSQLAGQYLALGLVPGDRVASLMPNRGALLVHYLACFKAGLTATPLNYRYQAPEIDHALQVSGASLLIAHAERNELLAASKQVAELPLGRISFGASDATHRRLEDLMCVEGSTPKLPPLQPDAPAFIFFTSGSTGKPKGVTHTHSTFGWILASAVAGLAITPDDVFLPATSASHVACSSFSLAGLAAGACVAIARSFGGDELLPLLRQTRPSLLCMLPAPLFGLVRDHGATRDDFQSLRRCICGGDKISAELEREFIELTGLAIEEVYGMTETGTSAINPTAANNRIGSIGQLAPGYEASIRDADGAEVAADQPGRLWIRSGANTIGYWNRPDATAETIVDGWLDTGDLVSHDEQDYLWFRGRKKQIIIHDGSNICPQEVEDSLLEHTAVASAAVVGVHDLVHGETVRAYVVFRPGVERPTLPELMQFSRDRVGDKAPEQIIVLDEMPTNAVGKVNRTALMQLADAEVNRHLS
ncbi:MAG TPA: class I adenylate-forming enzyme family protein [Planctomycetaceae bacterium]|nr:class I adenylate-forming enzyme family protein [Planctomycetaceae bacterium]